LDDPERIVFLALLGKELGHLDCDGDLFSGIGLARAASDSEDMVQIHMLMLRPHRTLLRDEWIQPCGGNCDLVSGHPGDLADTEFELAPKATAFLGLNRLRTKRRHTKLATREPKLSMSQLVLSDNVRRAISLALTHAKYAKVLLSNWGLGEVFQYGRGVTLLFSGPPGTGKTACAEALAKELGRPILVANYAEIQDCFVGQTEKNITRAFNPGFPRCD
jgi:hypothetical protein